MYEFENDDMIDFEGVELQGYVESTYDELVDIFGDPTIGEDMTDAKWVLQFKMPLDEEGYSEDCEYVTATYTKKMNGMMTIYQTEYIGGTYQGLTKTPYTVLEL